jgi:hypothetical protein
MTAGADIDPISRHVRSFVSACLAGDPSAVRVGPVEGAAAAAMCHAPAAAHAEAVRDGRETRDDVVRDEVRSMCGPVVDLPIDSFLAHLRGVGGAAGVVDSGVRGTNDGTVAGAPGSPSYRPGYTLTRPAGSGSQPESEG